jgi:hypothetical protein
MATVPSKQKILDEIKRLASAANGIAPGQASFKSETGITKHDWYPHYWVRWSDAIVEAGFARNPFTVTFSPDLLITKHIELIRELRRFPIESDFLLKRQRDRSFPNERSFCKLVLSCID